MRASQLRESAILQRWTGSAWDDVGTLYAEILPSGRAGEGAAQGFQVTLPWGRLTENILPTDDLQPTHRLVWKSRTLEIFEVMNVDQRNQEMRLECREMPQTAPA